MLGLADIQRANQKATQVAQKAQAAQMCADLEDTVRELKLAVTYLLERDGGSPEKLAPWEQALLFPSVAPSPVQSSAEPEEGPEEITLYMIRVIAFGQDPEVYWTVDRRSYEDKLSKSVGQAYVSGDSQVEHTETEIFFDPYTKEDMDAWVSEYLDDDPYVTSVTF